MSARTQMFALAAIATLSTIGLAPTSASAFGHFDGGHPSGHGSGLRPLNRIIPRTWGSCHVFCQLYPPPRRCLISITC